MYLNLVLLFKNNFAFKINIVDTKTIIVLSFHQCLCLLISYIACIISIKATSHFLRMYLFSAVLYSCLTQWQKVGII